MGSRRDRTKRRLSQETQSYVNCEAADWRLEAGRVTTTHHNNPLFIPPTGQNCDEIHLQHTNICKHVCPTATTHRQCDKAGLLHLQPLRRCCILCARPAAPGDAECVGVKALAAALTVVPQGTGGHAAGPQPADTVNGVLPLALCSAGCVSTWQCSRKSTEAGLVVRQGHSESKEAPKTVVAQDIHTQTCCLSWCS